MDTDKIKQAEKLMLEAALDMTRLKRKMRQVAKMVLLDGLPQAEAARRARVTRQTVNQAVKAAQAKLAEVRAYVQTQAP